MIKEIKILTLREVSAQYNPMDHPEKLIEFWRKEIAVSPWFDTEKECLVVVSLDSKLNIKTFNLVSIGLVNRWQLIRDLRVGQAHSQERLIDTIAQ